MLKVAVIDGSAISRNLLTSVLVSGGYEVIGDANCTPAGLAAMIKLQPQLVCIDIGEFDDEGLGRLTTLRAGLPKALVLLVSGKLDASTLQLGLKHGAHGFIVKPFKAANVLMSIRNAVIKVAQQHRAARKDGSQDAGNDDAADNPSATA